MLLSQPPMHMLSCLKLLAQLLVGEILVFRCCFKRNQRFLCKETLTLWLRSSKPLFSSLFRLCLVKACTTKCPNGPPFELQFLQELVSQTFFHNTYGICHQVSKSKNKLCLQFFHCLQIVVLSFSLSQTTMVETGFPGTFSSAEKSSQGMRVAPRLPGLAENLSVLEVSSFSLFWVTSHYLVLLFVMFFWDWICFKMYSAVPLSTAEALSESWESISTRLSMLWETNPLSICVFVLPDPCKDWCAWLWKVSSISRRHARDVHQLSRTCCMLVRMDRIEPQAITACWMHRSRVSSNICIIYEVMLLNIF